MVPSSSSSSSSSLSPLSSVLMLPHKASPAVAAAFLLMESTNRQLWLFTRSLVAFSFFAIPPCVSFLSRNDSAVPRLRRLLGLVPGKVSCKTQSITSAPVVQNPILPTTYFTDLPYFFCSFPRQLTTLASLQMEFAAVNDPVSKHGRMDGPPWTLNRFIMWGPQKKKRKREQTCETWREENAGRGRRDDHPSSRTLTPLQTSH